jgi:hypothetical protein
VRAKGFVGLFFLASIVASLVFATVVAASPPAPGAEAGHDRIMTARHASGRATDTARLSDDIVISAIDIEQVLPSAAYNWKRDQYLVVWHDVWPVETRDIRGQRVSGDGQLVGPEFTVFDSPTSESAQPSVAYDPVHDRYLVVWMHDRFGGGDWDIMGRFLPWNGPDPGLTTFDICTWSTRQWTPKVAYGRAVEEFLVVWNNEYQSGTLPWYISGRRVFADGSGFPPGDSALTINHPTENRLNADVTYNLARNEYLITYDNAEDIFGMRFTGHVDPDFGGEFGIAGWPSVEIRPAVAACAGADQYLVVWQSNQGGSNEAIYARYIDGDGTVAGVELVDDTTTTERNPAVACSASGDRYLLAWETEYTNGKYGIWARQARPEEVLEPPFPVMPVGPAEDRTMPVVAGGGRYLVVWEHQRAGTSYVDIHARLYAPYAVFLPVALRGF